MSRSVRILGLILALGLLLYIVWVLYPPRRYGPQVAEIIGRQRGSLQAEAGLAGDSSRNGLVEGELRFYWTHAKSLTPAFSAQSDMNEWLAGFGDADPGLGEALKSKKVEALEAVAEIEAILPALRRAVSRANFVLPMDGPLTLAVKDPSGLSIEELALALTAYSQASLLLGKPLQALETDVLILRLARLVSRNPKDESLALCATAVQAIGQKALIWTIDWPGSKWTPAQLDEVLKALEETQIPSQALLTGVERDLVAMENTLDSPRYMEILGTANYAVTPFLTFPGILERERRVFENLFYERLEAMREGRGVSQDSPLMGRFLGQTSGFDRFLPRGLVGEAREVDLARQRQRFLHFWIWMNKFRAQSGAWATDLKSLQRAGYQPLEGFRPDQLEWKGNSVRFALPGNLASLEQDHQKTGDPTWQYRLNHNSLRGEVSFLFEGRPGRIPLRDESWVLNLGAGQSD